MIGDIKGVPRHSFNQEGEYLELDTCGVALGSRLVITTEDHDGLTNTTFVRTSYKHGAMYDWRLEGDDDEARVALSHTHVSPEGAAFIDSSVILKLGNFLASSQAWDTEVPTVLGRIVALDVQCPYESRVAATIAALSIANESPLKNTA